MELPALFADLVGDFVGNKGGGGEDEVQFVDLFQFGLQRLIGVHRKARGRDLQSWPWSDGLLEVVVLQAADVVDQFHHAPLMLA
ncbi:hypothetical protein [Thauera sinica]|uniref:Uncharacterized protein n=1 Tax=Thauera sinica TaxID=2665146 RepID=A0ABW1ATY5_9RHOO|nr:hypothetical protein [Thauera sp. K11]